MVAAAASVLLRTGMWLPAPFRVHLPWALAATFALAGPSASAAVCIGDCDVDGEVTVDELVIGVNLALGENAVACPDFDDNFDGMITVDEILTGVAHALSGCPPLPPPATRFVASDPPPGGAEVMRTAWIRLQFAEPLPDGALDGFRLSCAGRRQRQTARRLDQTTVLVNPAGELPPEADCRLGWLGTGGVKELTFTTAAAGPPATVLYDRDNRRSIHPLPDDHFLVPDASKRNGVRLSIPVPAASPDVQGIFRTLLRGTAALDGFSPIAHFVIELSDAPEAGSLPRTPAESLDPLASIGLFDLTADSPTFGTRVPFRTDVRDDLSVTGVRSHSLLVFPSIPLEPGGLYGLVVTRRLRAAATRPFGPSTFMAAALARPQMQDSEALSRARTRTEEVLAALGLDPTQPIEPDDVALALRFTVRTTDDVPMDLLAIKEDLLQSPLPAFTITSVQPSSPPLAAIVRGTWEAPDWREGKYFKRDPQSGRPVRTRTNTVPFILALPRAALDRPVPITMYQHGNPGSAEREVPSDARDYLAAAGFAVIGFTDNLNREVSAGIDDTVEAITAQIVDVFFSLLQRQAVPDYWVQTNGEQLAFLRTIAGLGTLDVLPLGSPDGVPDVDPSLPLTYVGISQGANYAPGLIPYAPELRAAAVMVGGARLAEVLIHQQPQAFLDQLGAVFPNMTPADIWTALALFQTIYDNQDEHNHARFIYRAPLEIAGTTKKASILLAEGLNDTLVPNHATESLAWAMGPIPHLKPVQRAVPFLEPIDGPVRGNIDAETTAGFYQYVPVGVPGIDPTPGCVALSPRIAMEGHYCAQAAAESELQRVIFFQTALADPAPAIIDPLAE